MARIRHFPERVPLHRLKETGIIHRPRPTFSAPPKSPNQTRLGSNPSDLEFTPPIIHAQTNTTTSHAPSNFASLLLDRLADLSCQYLVLERIQNTEVEIATRALVHLRCHEYRSLWSREQRQNLTNMLQLYERLVEEVRTGRTVGILGMRAGGDTMRDVRREFALGIRKAVRDGVRMARHSGPGAG